MSAQDHLNSVQFKGKYLYHESHLNDRESIRSGGLEARTPFNSWGDGSKTPKGVYMSEGNNSEYGSSMNSAQHFGYDRWRVNVEGIGAQKDLDTGHTTSWHTPDNISPDRIKLVKKGSPNWQQNI